MSSPRFIFEQAVRGSDLPPLTRLVLLVLASRIDKKTGAIPDDAQPSLTTLETETGMSRSALVTHLKRAQEDGWLKRKVPNRADAQRNHTKTTYTLTLPELVREKYQPGSGDELALVREENQAGSTPVLELVRETDQASAGDAHRSVDDGFDRSDQSRSDVITTIQETIFSETGRKVGRDWAAQVYRQILAARPGVRNPQRYVATAIRREPARFVPTVSEPSGDLPVPRIAPLGERDNPANQTGADLARRLLAEKAAN